MKTISYLLILVTFVSFSGCQKLSLTGPASVSCTVYEHGTTVPVSGAWVYLVSNDHNTPSALSNKTQLAMQTDTTGTYHFNYQYEAGTSYYIYVKYTGSKLYGGQVPDYVWLKDRKMKGVDVGLTTRAYLTFTLIDTGAQSKLEYFSVFSNLNLTNITKDTTLVSSLPAYVKTVFQCVYSYKNSNKRQVYSPLPPPFYAAKGDTLHYTVYF